MNSCGTTKNKPAITQSCTYIETCIEDWNCTDWGSCVGRQQTRTCTDLNSCGTIEDKPSEQRDCEDATMESIFTPYIPSDCSNESIKATWDSIFKESSEGITILTSEEEDIGLDYCASYKIHGTMAHLLDINLLYDPEFNTTNIRSFQGNFSQEYIDVLSGLGNAESFYPIILLISPEDITQREILSSDEAQSDFVSIFKVTTEIWEFDNPPFGLGEGIYYFGHKYFDITGPPEETVPKEELATGVVYANSSLRKFLFTKFDFVIK